MMAKDSSINKLRRDLAACSSLHRSIVVPNGIDHDGSPHLRVTSQMASAKKITSNQCQNMGRDQEIRRIRAEGVSIENLAREFNLRYSTICKIVGEQT